MRGEYFDDNSSKVPLHNRYLEIAKGIYEWSGLPEDLVNEMPEGFIEECLFRGGGVGIKHTSSVGYVICQIKPVVLSIYGTPIKWLPYFPKGIMESSTSVMPMDVLSEEYQKDSPALWLQSTAFSRMFPYLRIMDDTIKALGLNVNALAQPIALYGDVGGEVDPLMLKTDMEQGERYIPLVKGGIRAEVLDLKATDHTQNLINTFKALDAECLTILGVQNSGVEKTSGVSDSESQAILQSISTVIGQGLKLRKQWCEKVNATFGLSLNVELSPEYEIHMMSEDSDDDVEEDVSTMEGNDDSDT